MCVPCGTKHPNSPNKPLFLLAQPLFLGASKELHRLKLAYRTPTLSLSVSTLAPRYITYNHINDWYNRDHIKSDLVHIIYRWSLLYHPRLLHRILLRSTVYRLAYVHPHYHYQRLHSLQDTLLTITSTIDNRDHITSCAHIIYRHLYFTIRVLHRILLRSAVYRVFPTLNIV